MAEQAASLHSGTIEAEDEKHLVNLPSGVAKTRFKTQSGACDLIDKTGDVWRDAALIVHGKKTTLADCATALQRDDDKAKFGVRARNFVAIVSDPVTRASYNLWWVATRDRRKNVPERLLSVCTCFACEGRGRVVQAGDEKDATIRELQAEVARLRGTSAANSAAADLNRNAMNQAKRQAQVVAGAASKKIKAADKRAEAANKEKERAVVMADATVAAVHHGAMELMTQTREEVESGERAKRKELVSSHREETKRLRKSLNSAQAEAAIANAGAGRAFQLREATEGELKQAQQQNRGLKLTVSSMSSRMHNKNTEKAKHDKARKTNQAKSKNKNRSRTLCSLRVRVSKAEGEVKVTHMCTRVQTHARMHAPTGTRTHTHMRTHTHTHTHTHARTRTRARTHTNTHMHTHTHTHTRTHTHTHTHTHSRCCSGRSRPTAHQTKHAPTSPLMLALFT